MPRLSADQFMVRHQKLWEIQYILCSYGVECTEDSSGGYISYLTVTISDQWYFIDYHFDESFTVGGVTVKSHYCSTVGEVVEVIVRLVAESLEL